MEGQCGGFEVLQRGGGCRGPPVPGAHHHTQRVLAGLQHTRQPRRQLLEGRAVGEGEQQKDGVRLLPAGLEEERRPSPTSAPHIPPHVCPQLTGRRCSNFRRALSPQSQKRSWKSTGRSEPSGTAGQNSVLTSIPVGWQRDTSSQRPHSTVTRPMDPTSPLHPASPPYCDTKDPHGHPHPRGPPHTIALSAPQTSCPSCVPVAL